MEEKKNWEERLGGYDSMEEAMFVTIDEKTVYAIDELKEFIQQELDKAREEGKKEAFTKDEWFMLKLAMNDIFNSGNTAYEEISEKIESYLN